MLQARRRNTHEPSYENNDGIMSSQTHASDFPMTNDYAVKQAQHHPTSPPIQVYTVSVHR